MEHARPYICALCSINEIVFIWGLSTHTLATRLPKLNALFEEYDER